MTKQKKKSSTQWMIEVLSADRVGCVNLPQELLCGLRTAVDLGLTCEEISAVIILAAGVVEARERMSGPELLERTKMLVSTMQSDVRRVQGEEEQRERNRMFQRKRRREKKASSFLSKVL